MCKPKAKVFIIKHLHFVFEYVTYRFSWKKKVAKTDAGREVRSTNIVSHPLTPSESPVTYFNHSNNKEIFITARSSAAHSI